MPQPVGQLPNSSAQKMSQFDMPCKIQTGIQGFHQETAKDTLGDTLGTMCAGKVVSSLVSALGLLSKVLSSTVTSCVTRGTMCVVSKKKKKKKEIQIGLLMSDHLTRGMTVIL